MKHILNFSILFICALSIIACKGDKAQKAGEAQEVKTTNAGKSLAVDPSVSKVLWVGYKPTKSHNGSINISDGTVTVENGKVTGGKFTIDMNTITNLDMDGGGKIGLEAHLKGTAAGKEDHFFNVAKYPTSMFEITKVTGVANNESSNALVYGNLTMKGITKSVSFPANISVTDNMVKVSSKNFSINRTDWGIQFMSSSFFDDLKDNFIKDNIDIAVNVLAK